jgi:hypothetical protein
MSSFSKQKNSKQPFEQQFPYIFLLFGKEQLSGNRNSVSCYGTSGSSVKEIFHSSEM